MRKTVRFRKRALTPILVLLAFITFASVDSPHVAGWKSYTNDRFGFSIEYPQDWKSEEPLLDGMGITFHAPIRDAQVALSGFLNLVGGSTQDGRQTLQEFASAHRRIINELYGKKNIPVKWEQQHTVTLGGSPAEQLTFSYQDEAKTSIIEMHIFSLGRNEGRGVRIKFPADHRKALMPVISQMLQTYQPGRDQDALTPFAPAPNAPSSR